MAKFSPQNTVLSYGKFSFDDGTLSSCLLSHAGIEAQIEHAENADELINHLLAFDRCIIIAEWDRDDVRETVKSLKIDEAVNLVPVMAIVADDDGEGIADAYTKGVDLCLRKSDETKYICHNISALLRQQAKMREVLDSLSELKTDAVNSFLLADLIRQYVPATVWDLATQHAEEQKLDIPHSELDLTVVFADIAQFTRITQHLSPRNVILKLNSIFEIVTAEVYAHQGDIDKFIGDAFFAVFDEPSDAVDAVKAIQERIEAINQADEDSQTDPFRLRIGVHTGRVIRGNVGGGARFDNTLIGDTVNIASRLESIAPPGGIVVSDSTREKAGVEVTGDRVMEVELRGRDVPITAARIYP